MSRKKTDLSPLQAEVAMIFNYMGLLHSQLHKVHEKYPQISKELNLDKRADIIRGMAATIQGYWEFHNWPDIWVKEGSDNAKKRQGAITDPKGSSSF